MGMWLDQICEITQSMMRYYCCNFSTICCSPIDDNEWLSRTVRKPGYLTKRSLNQIVGSHHNVCLEVTPTCPNCLPQRVNSLQIDGCAMKTGKWIICDDWHSNCIVNTSLEFTEPPNDEYDDKLPPIEFTMSNMMSACKRLNTDKVQGTNPPNNVHTRCFSKLVFLEYLPKS